MGGLVRVARAPDASGSAGTMAVGRTLPGRGAWLCAGSEPCFDLAVRRRAFGRALRVSIDDDDVAALRARLGTHFVPPGPAVRG